MMKFKQVWKMLRDTSAWSFSDDGKEVLHRDGFFYFKCASCIRLRRSEWPHEAVFFSGMFEHIAIGFAVALLHRKLRKKTA